jgi:serine/threonine-protein kinase HipA
MRYSAAYAVQLEDLFHRHVFNYVFSNGDAHLKNFSLSRREFGDYLLSPAYDLLCTGIHIPNESRCALEMFDEFATEFFRRNGFYGRPDFLMIISTGFSSEPSHDLGFWSNADAFPTPHLFILP